MSKFEAVIGLEIHAQLKTNTKAFCSCSNFFGDEPNTNICPVCLGLPGALPVFNEKAAEFAVKVGLALQCDIQKRSIFARKNYFYPDMPKNYQISQFELPICKHGYLDIDVDGVTKRIGLTRIHIEEDAGKLVHQGSDRISGSESSLVDLNRASTPLIEIVSEPDIRSGQEARIYMENLKLILQCLGVCDGNLEEGSMRADANISIRPFGVTQLGIRTEVKNLNSFRSVERAINSEIVRQIELVESGGTVVQQTRHYDDVTQTTKPLRDKEESHDYRYFPEPDLPPLILSDAFIQNVQKALPELPSLKLKRYLDMGLTKGESEILIQDMNMNLFFEDCLKQKTEFLPRDFCKWIVGDMNSYIKETVGSFASIKIKPDHLLSLLTLLQQNTISHKMAKDVLINMFETGLDPVIIVKESGFSQISDQSELVVIVDRILSCNPDVVEKIKAGKTNAANFLMGQVMKETKGQAKPDTVIRMILERVLVK